MSEEKEITAAAQAAFAAYHHGVAGAPLVMPDSWDMQPAEVRAGWLAAMQAGAKVLAGTVADLVAERAELLGRIKRIQDIANVRGDR